MRIAAVVILAMVFAPAATYAQSGNINNTLGTGGSFNIKYGATTFLSLSQADSVVNLNYNMRIPSTSSPSEGVLYKGTTRFIHNYGSNNVFFGLNSGNFTMTGYGENTAVGNYSLSSNTTGGENVAVGFSALGSNTTGIYNAAVGFEALLNNWDGSFNTGVGYESLLNNTSGSYNTAIGCFSLKVNYGSQNTAVGYGSSLSNSSGICNAAFGYSALLSNQSGNRNNAVGDSSLYSTTSSDNTAMGHGSLLSNSSGAENTAVGSNSLYSNTTNSGNTAVGFNSLYANTGYQNTAVGHHAMNANTSGNFNTALGYNAGSSVTTGYNLTMIGIDANPSAAGAGNEITLGNGFVASLRCNVQAISSLSDRRDKRDVVDLPLGLDFISQLKPRQFNWDRREWYEDGKPDGSKMQKTPTAGFIAQELDDAQTRANAEWLNLVLKSNPNRLEATPGNLLPIIVKAVQELKSENDALRNELAALHKSIAEQVRIEVKALLLKEAREEGTGTKTVLAPVEPSPINDRSN